MRETDTRIVLIVASDSDTFRLLASNLDKSQVSVIQSTMDDLFTQLKSTNVTLVLLTDVEPSTGNRVIKRIRQSCPWVETIAISHTDDTEDTHSMIAAGAFDALSRDFSNNELRTTITKAMTHSSMNQELTTLREQVAMNYGFDNLVGISDAITKLKQIVKRIAPTDISILIRGDSGSGKETLARIIHHHSDRRRERFTIIDCGALPADRFESLVFGSPGNESPSKAGMLAEADGGTLFFDDVDALPIAAQSRMLKFLLDYRVPMPDGTERKVDIRVMSATTRDIPALVRQGAFSEELFYQFGVVLLEIPSLADRTEDLELLVAYFLRRMTDRTGGGTPEISRDALDILATYKWPGNVRELENTLRRALALSSNNRIEVNDISFLQKHHRPDAVESGHKTILKSGRGLLDDNQRAVIVDALDENNWNFTQTAQELGIGRTTLWRKVKKYNLKRETIST